MSKRPEPEYFDPDSFFRAHGNNRPASNYAANSTIFTQGDPADSVFYIQSGRVKLSVTSPTGREAIVAMLGGTDFFGEGCLLAQTERLATATAMEDCSLYRIAKAEMLGALHEEAEFADRFMAHLLTRNSRAEADLVDHLLNSSEKRLARALLLLANFGKDGQPTPILNKISQETLAEMVGTTRPRISFFMNRFRKLGFIKYNGHIEVQSSLLSVLLRE